MPYACLPIPKGNAMNKPIITTTEELQQIIDASVRRAIKEAMPESKIEEDIGDINFASRVTGYSVSTLYKYAGDETKKLPVLRGHSDLLKFSRTDLIEWLRSNPKGKSRSKPKSKK